MFRFQLNMKTPIRLMRFIGVFVFVMRFCALYAK